MDLVDDGQTELYHYPSEIGPVYIDKTQVDDGESRLFSKEGYIFDIDYGESSGEEDEDEEEEDDEEEDDEEEDDEEEDDEEEDDLAMEINNREVDPKYELYKYGGMLYKRGRLSTRGLYTRVYTRYGFIENPKLNTDLLCFGVDALPSMEFNITTADRCSQWEKIQDVFLGETWEYNTGQIKRVEDELNRDEQLMSFGTMDCSE